MTGSASGADDTDRLAIDLGHEGLEETRRPAADRFRGGTSRNCVRYFTPCGFVRC
jgi:hypothetical protein